MDTNGRDRSLGTLSSPQRNNYFYGKLMDVPHFQMEQRYGNTKRWLMNRLGLGSGVLCGLTVTIKDKKVCVSPGVAVDGYGREIVVPHEVCLDPWTLTDECGCPKIPALSKTEAHDVYLCLAYKECQTDFMPVLVTDCNTKQECVPGTTVEGYCVLVHEGIPKTINADSDLCKLITGTAATLADLRKRLCTGASTTCPTPTEPCVTLATMKLSPENDGTIGNLDVCTYRSVVYSNAKLLDLILCLAERIEECCGEHPPATTTPPTIRPTRPPITVAPTTVPPTNTPPSTTVPPTPSPTTAPPTTETPTTRPPSRFPDRQQSRISGQTESDCLSSKKP